MRADLHVHSTHSDGSDGPERIAELAAGAGVSFMSLTDHDTASSQRPMAEAARNAGVGYINGIEVSAWDGASGRKAHILGYGYTKAKILIDFCDSVISQRRASGLAMVAKVASLGYAITEGEVLAHTHDGVIYRQHIGRALCEKGYADKVMGGLFRFLFGPGGPVRGGNRYPSAVEAVKAIREAGGVAVLAHPADYGNLGSVAALAKEGLGGLEAAHPRHTPKEAREAAEIAAAHGLFVTGGTDYHGAYGDPQMGIGGCGAPICPALAEMLT